MIALLDACVLYPPSLRDLLMWLAVVKAYEPRWTDAIHAEWIRNTLKNRPELKPEVLARTQILMDRVNPKCLVVGYEQHITNLSLPDADDRHVLAAAIESSASNLVTFNLSDFPKAVLETYGIQALHPDVFLVNLFHSNDARFLMGLKRHRASLKNPPKNIEEYLASLTSSGLIRTALQLQSCQEDI